MTGSLKLPESSRLYDLVFWAIAGAIAAAAIYVHMAASLTFSVPSGDEALFVWEARAFQTANSFIAPEVDPSRPILLLPFAYQAVVGVVFKVFGCSIEIARHVSLVLVLIGFGLMAMLVRRFVAPTLSLLVVGAFLFNPHFVNMANHVRMESLLFAVICGALLLMQRGQMWMALALLSVSPMIHPYGMFYLLPAVIFALAASGLLRVRPGRAVVVMFVISGLVWLAHGIYVLRFWDSFIYDSAHRFGEMATGTGKAAVNAFGWRQVGSLGLIAATAALGVWRRAGIGYLLVFAVGTWLHGHVRIEEPYAPFDDFTYLLLSLAILEIAGGALVVTKASATPLLRSAVMGFLAIILLGILYKSGRIEGPINYLDDLELSGMRVAPPGAYFRDEDRRALQNVLKSFEPGRPITVEVYPWADALLIADLTDERIRYQLPFFDPLFRPAREWVWGYGPTERPIADLYIVRVSRHTPPHLRYRPDAMFDRALKHPEIEKPTIVYSRDSTEIWYAMRNRGKAK